MIHLSNYEIALSTLPDGTGGGVPFVALSFASQDAPGLPAGPWDQAWCSMAVVDEGICVRIGQCELLFELALASSQSSPPRGLDRAHVLALMSAHRQLFVCGFDHAGDLIASIGFKLDPG